MIMITMIIMIIMITMQYFFLSLLDDDSDMLSDCNDACGYDDACRYDDDDDV